jgi:hypothetical protein
LRWGVPLRVTALELTNAFELGPKEALAKYEGKVIRVTGVLLGSRPDPITEDYAILQGGKEVHVVHGIPAERDKLPQGMTGVNRLVTIQGICRGIQNTFDAIDITECVFIKN